MGQEFNLISSDAQRALEDFAQDFALALTQPGVEQWAKENGLYRSSRALRTTYPVPVSAAGYAESKGDVKYRDIFQKSLSLTPKTWQDGVAELASVIEAPDFIGWTSEPAAIAAAASALLNQIIADALAENATCWGGSVFDVDVGTYDNDFTGAGTTPTAPNLKLAKSRMRKIKAPNGKPLGLRLTHILIPSALEETAKDLLEQDMVIQAVGSTFAAVDNRHKGTVKMIVPDELADDSQWYGLGLNKPGMVPWIVQDEGAPEEIRSDKTSHLYQTTLKVGVAYVLRGNGVLALPQCMQRWAGAA